MILGGMLWTKMQDRTIQTAIDLCELGLDRIDENEDAFLSVRWCLCVKSSCMKVCMHIRRAQSEMP